MTILTILDVLAAASLTGMEELNTIALTELYHEAIKQEFPNPPKNAISEMGAMTKGKDNVRAFWNDIYTKRLFDENHPVCKASNKFTKDPKLLILSGKMNHKTFNSLSMYSLGNSRPGKNSSNSYHGKDNQAVGATSTNNTGTTSANANKILEEANSRKSEDRHESSSSKGRSGSNASTASAEAGTGVIDRLTDKIKELLQEELAPFEDRLGEIREEANTAKESAITAANDARTAKKAADDNTILINGLDKTMKENSGELDDLRNDLGTQTRKLTTLTNDFLAVGLGDPDAIEGYTLIQYYALSKNCRLEYRKAVMATKINGRIVLDINPNENATYIDLNEDNPADSDARNNQIEQKLALDEDGNFDRERRVKIKSARVVQRKSEKFTILVQIDAVAKTRGDIVDRLIKDRYLNYGHFGLRQDIPEQYNIDIFLTYIKHNARDPATGRKVIYGFDTNRSGYYVIYINDHEDKGEMYNTKGRALTEKEKCSIIRPGCPREFAKLKEKYHNKDDLLKLTKPNEYFCYAGHILKVPGDEMFRR